jgi:hypothetical protein
MIDRCIIISAMLIVAFGSSAEAAEWKEIDVSEATLVATVPGVRSSIGQFVRRTLGFRKFVEVGNWSGPSAGFPKAQIVLFHLDPTGSEVFTTSSRPPIDDSLADAMSGRAYSLQEPGEGENILGEIEYRRFAVDDVVPCVFFRQFSGRSGERFDQIIGGGAPLGTLSLEGWYCERPGGILSDSTIELFFKGIGVKDWAVP